METSPAALASDARQVDLGGRTFSVPLLPLRHNRLIYPLCRGLSADALEDDSFVGRLATSGGAPDAVHDDEWDQLIEIAFHGACAGDKDLTREAFESLPITPAELISAFFVIRLQTGGWVAPESNPIDSDDEGAAPGEATGA